MPTVLITGAAKNIGKATALELAKQGWDVGINYKSSQKDAEQLASEIRLLNRKAWTIKADITKQQEAENLVVSFVEQAKQLDLLVLNAGPYIEVPIGGTTLEQWHAMFDGNLNSAFYCIQAALPYFRQQRSGQIIALTVAMTHQVRASHDASAYYIAKLGLTALIKAIAVQEAKYGIRANAVAPGIIETSKSDLERLNYLKSKIPLLRAGKPEDIAKTITFLASSEATYINGVVLGVDGGFGE